MELLDPVAVAVRDANPSRSYNNIERRILKLMEELGEAGRAFLSVTSPSNPRQLTWDDVREELADCLIVAFDIAWTRIPDEHTADALPSTVWNEAPPRGPLDERAILRAGSRVGGLAGIMTYPGSSLPAITMRSAITEVVKIIASLNLSGFPDIDSAEVEARLKPQIDGKLDKWRANRAAMTVETDDI